MQDKESLQVLLTTFFAEGKRLNFKKGEIILGATDEPRGVYFIEKGYVKIYSIGKDGTEHLHMNYQPGEIFPLIWAFEGAVRNVYYEALNEVSLRVVQKDTFLEFVEQTPRVANALLHHAVNMFKLYAARIDNLLYSNSYERTAYRLLSLLNRHGSQVKDGYVLDIPVTHQHIASSTNLSRETTSRALERMLKKHIISYDEQHHIVVTDLPALIKIIGEQEVLANWPELKQFVH